MFQVRNSSDRQDYFSPCLPQDKQHDDGKDPGENHHHDEKILPSKTLFNLQFLHQKSKFRFKYL